MRVLILGSGGREHALGWTIRQRDAQADLLFCPGNGGTRAIGRNVAGNPSDPEAVIALAESERPDLVVVGPEGPLISGVTDQLRKARVPVFGPSRRAALIEGSKVFAKTLMREHGIPTAGFEVYHDPETARASFRKALFPQVVKADGLAQGKGVLIVRNAQEGESAIREIMETRRFGSAGERILIEDYLQGEEVSAFALVRDEEVRLLPLAQDHKRIGEGETGANTGGMGAITPYPRTTPELLRSIEVEVFAPVVQAMARDDRPFRGLLYAGLMMVHGRPMVLEFNCRFGDPETQALAPLMGKGFFEALCAVAGGTDPLPEIETPRTTSGARAAATVVLASAGYPEDFRTGHLIQGIEQAESLPETWVFQAGTRQEEKNLQTAGGRVLAVTGRADDLKGALRRAYEGVSLIEYEGKTFRRDIGRRALA